MKRTLTLFAALAGLTFALGACKSRDVIIINNPPTSTGSSSKTTTVTRPQGKTDPTTIEPVKPASTFSN